MTRTPAEGPHSRPTGARRKAPTWQADGKGVTAGGDVGGDWQAGESWAVRYIDRSSLQDQEKRVASVFFYPEQRGDSYVVTRQTEMTICTDATDPGRSEIWADYAYHTYAGTYRRRDAAEAEARRRAEGHSADDIDWDGES